MLLLWENPILESFSLCQTKATLKNYTEIALKNFQCSIFFCNSDFQSSCDFSVWFSPGFSATTCHSVNILRFPWFCRSFQDVWNHWSKAGEVKLVLQGSCLVTSASMHSRHQPHAAMHDTAIIQRTCLIPNTHMIPHSFVCQENENYIWFKLNQNCFWAIGVKRSIQVLNQNCFWAIGVKRSIQVIQVMKEKGRSGSDIISPQI